MEEWAKQPVSYLKRLVKSRAGRIAELQMEIKILEGVIEKKVREGDLGASRESPSPAKKPEEKAENPKEGAEPREPEPAEPEEETKINQKSSSHAFQEIE